MKYGIMIEFDNPAELAALSDYIAAIQETNDEFGIGCPEDGTAPAAPEPTPVAAPTAETKKGTRGRPKKAAPDEVVAAPAPDAVKGAAVLDQLKASVATPAPAETVTAAAAPPAAEGEITNGQQLQQYILSLVHQKRLDPVAVKAKVYPKYNVVRSLDLTPEQVPAAKADIDAMLKGGEPKPASDLDL